MKIVAAIDDSVRGPQVLSWALDRAGNSDEVIALKVWNLSLVGSLENPFADLHQAQLSATVRLNKLIDRVTRERWDRRQHNVTVRADVRHGDPTKELIEASQTADMLILGNAHHSSLGEIGSVARAVVRGAQCAVVMVPVDMAAAEEEAKAATP